MTWRNQAACLGADIDTFFIGLGLRRGQGRISNAAKARALALCAGCPVRVECLDYAITTYQDAGIWGGMTASQRIKLRRTRMSSPVRAQTPAGEHPLKDLGRGGPLLDDEMSMEVPRRLWRSGLSVSALTDGLIDLQQTPTAPIRVASPSRSG